METLDTAENNNQKIFMMHFHDIVSCSDYPNQVWNSWQV